MSVSHRHVGLGIFPFMVTVPDATWRSWDVHLFNVSNTNTYVVIVLPRHAYAILRHSCQWSPWMQGFDACRYYYISVAESESDNMQCNALRTDQHCQVCVSVYINVQTWTQLSCHVNSSELHFFVFVLMKWLQARERERENPSWGILIPSWRILIKRRVHVGKCHYSLPAAFYLMVPCQFKGLGFLCTWHFKTSGPFWNGLRICFLFGFIFTFWSLAYKDFLLLFYFRIMFFYFLFSNSFLKR